MLEHKEKARRYDEPNRKSDKKHVHGLCPDHVGDDAGQLSDVNPVRVVDDFVFSRVPTPDLPEVDGVRVVGRERDDDLATGHDLAALDAELEPVAGVHELARSPARKPTPAERVELLEENGRHVLGEETLDEFFGALHA